MRGITCCCLGLLVLLASPPATAIGIGQIDDFSDGTLSGWAGGSSPANLPSGGPAGASDRYLHIDAGNDNLGVYNAAQWAGDYLAAGVTAIRLEVRNTGPDPVALRITAFGPGQATAFTSAQAIMLAASNAWTTIEFALTQADLVRTAGTGSLDATLSSVARLLIRHDPDPISPPGQPNGVTASLGIDNVVAVPEPQPASLIMAGLAVIGAIRRLSRRALREFRE